MSNFEVSENAVQKSGAEDQVIRVDWSPADNEILKNAQKGTVTESNTVTEEFRPSNCGIRPLPPCHRPGPGPIGHPDDGGIPGR